MLAELLVLTREPVLGTGQPPAFALALPSDEDDERWIASGRVTCDVRAGVLRGCEITLSDAFLVEVAAWLNDEQLIADELDESVTAIVATAAALLAVPIAVRVVVTSGRSAVAHRHAA